MARIYELSVHRQLQDIPNVSKFSYQKGALYGSAFMAIVEISVINENYNRVAIQREVCQLLKHCMLNCNTCQPLDLVISNMLMKSLKDYYDN